MGAPRCHGGHDRGRLQGWDVRQPDIAAKSPEVYSVIHPHARHDVRDYYGHGTFVASLAAGSVTNGDGIAGFGGDARLMCVQIVHADGSISDVDEAAGIVYAVKHGTTRAVRYAQRHGVLVVAAAGNEFDYGNPVEYPAALLQPKGSDGRGGSGLSVGASTLKGHRAPFSNAGSYVSLVAPGENVFAALSGYSDWARMVLPGSTAGVYGSRAAPRSRRRRSRVRRRWSGPQTRAFRPGRSLQSSSARLEATAPGPRVSGLASSMRRQPSNWHRGSHQPRRRHRSCSAVCTSD